MAKKLWPDYVFAAYSDVSPDFLMEHGIKLVISDIDNTLAPYEQAQPDEKLRAWIESLKENGIRLAFISNNSAERVELFNRSLGLPAFPDSHKPSIKGLKAAMKECGGDETDSCCLGDQLLTDVWAARRCGLRVILVPPIKDKKTLFFRAKRLMEKPVMRSFLKHNPDRVRKLPDSNPWFK